VPTQQTSETLPDRPAETAAGGQRWRSPLVLRLKSVLLAAAGVVVAVVFFPVWGGIPVAVLLGAWGLSVGVLGASVAVDPAAGVLVLRMGLIVRRIRLTDITAVLVDQAKVSIGRANGGEVSVYTWRKSPLDALLRVPAVASDVGHAISKAVALARAYSDADAAGPASFGRTPERTRSRLATAWLGAVGATGVAGALLVRVHWHNPAMTVLGVIIALVLGGSGLLYLLVAFWILLTGRAPRLIETR
jgi:hypothetical protein